ncbi:MAG TPA: vanadium-dependent haloperoxidase [Cellvibrio sp.]
MIKGLAVAATVASANAMAAFDMDNGYAPIEVIIPSTAQFLAQDVSISGSDATLVLRFTAMLSNSWFDAVAPYHPTQVGVYSRFSKRLTETNNHDKNVAVFYASYRVLSSLAPARQAQWDAMLTNVGLDPTDNSMDPNTPVGIGNIAGSSVVNARLHDGMNQLGDEGGIKYNRKPYKDYTNYVPVNTFYELNDPSKWQPAEGTNGYGKFNVQQFVTPQMGKVRAYSFRNPDQFNIPYPWKSDARNREAYKAQADEVLNISANLTDEQKLIAELFDYKTRSLGFSTVFAVKSHNQSYIDAIQTLFLANVAEFDTTIAVWNQKVKYNTVRPWTAISYIYGDRKVTAWGGPGKGTVNDIPGNQWRSYLPVADHAEYPSGSASFCAAHTYVLSKRFNEEKFGWSVTIPAGGSTYEKGITPKVETTLTFPTYASFKDECGKSRQYAGVHFRDSIDAGYSIGERVGAKAFKFVQNHINGNNMRSFSDMDD